MYYLRKGGFACTWRAIDLGHLASRQTTIKTSLVQVFLDPAL